MRRFSGSRLVVATHNGGKLAEIGALLSGRGITVVGSAALGLVEPDETDETFLGNARIKARSAVQATGLAALADDSGLAVDALSGAPGVRTADWAQGPDGRDFRRAMTRVHDGLVRSGAAQPWTARFCCTLVLAWPDGDEVACTGVAPGRIVWPMQGTGGHGYDPIFVPDGETRTYAEMTAQEKNQGSHRALALRKLVETCFG